MATNFTGISRCEPIASQGQLPCPYEIHRTTFPVAPPAIPEDFREGELKDRPALEIADILRKYGPAFRRQYGPLLLKEHRCAMNALVKCRTAEMGGHFKICNKCGFEHWHYRSCRNRNCPKCESLPCAEWTADREAELLDTTYFHVVFKLPTEIADIALQNKKVVLGILFEVVAKTLKKVGANPQHLGAQLGFIAALHTWGQRLEWHPHLHCLIPGGGLSPDGQWISCGPNFLPVDVLATTFRQFFLRALRRAFKAGKLQLAGDLQPLRQPAAFARYLADAGARDERLCQAPAGRPEANPRLHEP